jgi:hypothetical protein
MSQSPQVKLAATGPRCSPVGARDRGQAVRLAVEDLLERVTEREKEDRG